MNDLGLSPVVFGIILTLSLVVFGGWPLVVFGGWLVGFVALLELSPCPNFCLTLDKVLVHVNNTITQFLFDFGQCVGVHVNSTITQSAMMFASSWATPTHTQQP